MKNARYVIAVSLMVGQLALPTAAAASSMSDHVDGAWVDQTMTVWYNTQANCLGATGYQLTTLTTSWVRRSAYATIGSAPWAAGVFGWECASGSFVAQNPSGNLTPVTWVNNSATRTVSLNFPMTKLEVSLATGAWVNGKVMYRNRFNQYLCTALSFTAIPVNCG